ncbi:MAG: hypothetical protein ACPLSP_06725 [Fervidicoccus fontis]
MENKISGSNMLPYIEFLVAAVIIYYFGISSTFYVTVLISILVLLANIFTYKEQSSIVLSEIRKFKTYLIAVDITIITLDLVLPNLMTIYFTNIRHLPNYGYPPSAPGFYGLIRALIAILLLIFALIDLNKNHN